MNERCQECISANIFNFVRGCTPFYFSELFITTECNSFKEDRENTGPSEAGGGLQLLNNLLVLAPLFFEKSLQIANLKLKIIRQTIYHHK